MKKTFSVFSAVILVIAITIMVIALVVDKDSKPEVDTETATAASADTAPDTEDVEAIVTSEDKDPFSDDMISTLSARQAFVYDISSEKYLFEKNTDSNIIPASITKIFSALFALKSMPAYTEITPKDELSLVQPGASIAYIKENHRLTLEMLIEGMLLPSGNDAAYVTAAAVGRKLAGNSYLDGKSAVDLFMKKLNEYAVSVGCTGTHFTVPDGDAVSDHYTTAHDLTIIAKLAVENEIISKYASTVTDNVTYASGHKITWNNTNQLINPESPHYSEYATGLKTGSLENSFSVLCSAEIEGKKYIIGVFDSPSAGARFADAVKLINTIAYMVN